MVIFSRLIGWQLCSILLTATGYFSQRLSSVGVDMPTAQATLAYVLLFLLHAPVLCCRTPSRATTSVPWWQWLLIALADVEANYLLVLAYQYTDITMVCTLDAFTVPTVMVISATIFHERFSPRQLGGALICVVGVFALVVSDVLASDFTSETAAPLTAAAPDRRSLAWLGDVLVLCGAVLCGERGGRSHAPWLVSPAPCRRAAQVCH